MDIDEYLYADIVYSILNFLDRDSSFRFLNTCSQLVKYRSLLYDKYYFVADKVQHKDRVKKLVLKLNNNYDNLNQFVNVSKIIIECETFNDDLNNLPSGLKYLKIVSHLFDKSLDNLPDSIESFCLHGRYYNKIIKKFPINLKKIEFEFTMYVHDIAYIITRFSENQLFSL